MQIDPIFFDRRIGSATESADGGHGNLKLSAAREGMSIQIAKDGRRILWLGHESAPKSFTAVDVSDPRPPSCEP